MNLSEFDYELPPDLIAQTPADERTESRLLVLDQSTSAVSHEMFRSLGMYLCPGDLLLLNDTRVIPARLFGRRATGGRVEILLNEPVDPETHLWDCLSRSSRPLKPGSVIRFDEDLVGQIIPGAEHPRRLIRFSGTDDVPAALDRIGHMPLPPYIGRADGAEDRERYQTVYACHAGALAAPTAGLHFSNDFLGELETAGIEIRTLTLHVGLGTFLPVRSENIYDHRMHEERFVIPGQTADAVNRAKREGRRVVAVGTTVTRTLEAAWDPDSGTLKRGPGRTDIFIYPGYEFRVIDALLTNFHLPQSTLLMLVSAFAGRDQVLDAYREAIRCRYRFYSYGDCMLIR